ncbi:MAG: hypothetical protein ACKO5F_06865 [Synechococcus sp.]
MASRARLEQTCLGNGSGTESGNASPADLDTDLQAVVAALAPVLAGLDQLQAAGGPGPGSPAAPPVADLAEQLEAIADLLRSSDGSANDALAELAAQLAGTAWAPPLEKALRAAAAYDYDAALAALDGLAAAPAGPSP